jgi:hypothetical protein
LENSEKFLDFKPPWVQFPYVTSQNFVAYLKQGETEFWADNYWRPFWAKLSVEQKSQYLDQWHAGPEWIEAIEFIFTNDPQFDVEADALESKMYHEQRQSDLQVEGNKSFFRRLFKKK